MTFGTEGDELAIANFRAALNLDKPFLQRYGAWLYAFLQGDWGESELYGLPVRTLIEQRLPLSLTLSLSSFLLASVCGTGLGILLAKGTRARVLLALCMQAFIALPSFLIGIALIFLFAVRWQLLPTGGLGVDNSLFAQIRYLLLPSIALALPQTAILARFSEAALREVLEAPFITTARAKGLSANKVLMHQALPVVAAPILALSGLQFAFLISGTVIIESVFALPGLGSLFINAALARDLPLVLALAMFFAVATLMANALAETLARLLEPYKVTDEARML